MHNARHVHIICKTMISGKSIIYYNYQKWISGSHTGTALLDPILSEVGAFHSQSFKAAKPITERAIVLTKVGDLAGHASTG